MSTAQVELEKLGIPELQLRSEWAAQLKEQTKPAPRMFCYLLICSEAYIFW